MRRAGLRVPEDVSIIGFDDILPSEFTEPPLTTVRLPRTTLAERTFEALVSHLGVRAGESPKRGAEYEITTELIVRSSTAPVRTR